MPKEFNEYVQDNEERIMSALSRGTAPYWVRDNTEYISIAMSGEDVSAASAAVAKEASRTSTSVITPTRSVGGGSTTPPTEPPTATSGGFDDNNPFSSAAYSDERKANAIYPDTPKEADNILRAEAGKVWQTLSANEKDALYRYTGYEYKSANNFLRGVPGASDSKKEMIRNIDSALEKTSLAQDMYFRRGSDVKDLQKFGFPKNAAFNDYTLQDAKNMLIGKEGIEHGYWSCGASQITGYTDCNIDFKIYCPKGIKGIYAEPFARNGEEARLKWDGRAPQETFSPEQEFMLARGYKMRVIGVEYQDINNPSKGWRVSVELIGYEPQRI